jgi:signal peptidase I
MSKRKSDIPKLNLPAIPGLKPVAPSGKSTSANASASHDMGRTIRETVESIVIAFVLAFLVRTFEAEAFVIPTGSMAPTLQGRHKDLPCENCGYRIRASASEEDRVQEMASRFEAGDPRRATREVYNSQVIAVTCPMCRHRTSVDPDTPSGREHPSFNGDRILVAKFPYEFIDPRRWDIVVFKYPNDAKTNYIKRLVGLPNETVRIYHGDIYTRPNDQDQFSIERKRPEKQLAMAQVVYDNNYVVPEMARQGWPTRWQPWPKDDANGWKAADEGKAFEIDGREGGGVAWVKYRHTPPTQTDWLDLREGRIAADDQPRPQLITDFYAYNNFVLRHPLHDGGATGMNWVGDLMLETEVEVRSEKGNLLLDLVEGGVHFRASIDVATGIATLSIDGRNDFHPKATTSVKGPGDYQLRLANFDDQLTLWVDGDVAAFDGPTTYSPLNNDQPRATAEDPGDLAPAGIGADGNLSATVRNLKVKRDIYYIADRYNTHERGGLNEYEPGTRLPSMDPDELAAFFSNPEAWRQTAADGKNAFELRRAVEFASGPDQFFVLGDNSPASLDGRLWSGQHFVGREMMIGKALFIYWPHGLNFIPGTGIPFPLGMFPNVRDMGFVR